MMHGTPIRSIGALAFLALAMVGAVVQSDFRPVQGFAAQAAPARQDDASRKEWLQLFNGRDLNDWVIKFARHDLGENVNDTFRVEDGMLKVRYDKWTAFDREFGHIFYKQPFSYYLLAAEYRFVGEQVAGAGPSLAWARRNNGLMLHAPDPKTMLKDQDFPISIEVQLLGGLSDGKPRSTANVCTPGTNIVMNGQLHTPHCTNSTSKTYDGDQWVRVEVLVHGDELVRHMIDGQTVLEYTEAADWRRRGVAHRSESEGRRYAADRRLHLAAGRDRARGFPQGRTAESGGMRRPESAQLQDVCRQVEAVDVPVLRLTA